MRGIRSKYSPFAWSKRTVKVVLTAFYMIAVPFFVYFGLQPAKAATESAHLSAPAINLDTPVTESILENGELSVPARIAGVYSLYDSKLLLIGHSSTVFKHLHQLNLGDAIIYNDETYHITDITTKPKSNINMISILSPADQKTLVLMTCAGESLGSDDYTHRLIITAN